MMMKGNEDKDERIKQLEQLLKEKDKSLKASREEIDKLSFASENATKRLLQLQKQMGEREGSSSSDALGLFSLGSTSSSSSSSASQPVIGSVFGTLLSSASGSLDEINKLKKEMTVLQEELNSKIKENQTVHIRLFDEKEAHNKIVKTLQEKCEKEASRAKIFEEEAIARSSETEVLGSENRELQLQVSEKEKVISKLGNDILNREKHASGYYRDLVDLSEAMNQAKLHARARNFALYPYTWTDGLMLKARNANSDELSISTLSANATGTAASTATTLMTDSQHRWNKIKRVLYELDSGDTTIDLISLNSRSSLSSHLLAQSDADMRSLHAFARVCAAATCLVGDKGNKIYASLPKHYVALFQSIEQSLCKIYSHMESMYYAPWIANEKAKHVHNEILLVAESFSQFSQMSSNQHQNVDSIKQSIVDCAKLLESATVSKSSDFSLFIDQITKVSNLLKGFGIPAQSAHSTTTMASKHQKETANTSKSKNPFAASLQEEEEENARKTMKTNEGEENASYERSDKSSNAFSLSIHIRTDGMRYLASWIGVFARALHDSLLVRNRSNRSLKSTGSGFEEIQRTQAKKYMDKINNKVIEIVKQQQHERDQTEKEIQNLRNSLVRAQKQLMNHNASVANSTVNKSDSIERKKTGDDDHIVIDEETNVDKNESVEVGNENVFKDEDTGLVITIQEEDVQSNAESSITKADDAYKVRVVNTRNGKEADHLTIQESEFDVIFELERQIRHLKQKLHAKQMEV